MRLCVACLLLLIAAPAGGSVRGSWNPAPVEALHRVESGRVTSARAPTAMAPGVSLLVELRGARSARVKAPAGATRSMRLFTSSDGRLFVETTRQPDESGALLWNALPEDDVSLLLVQTEVAASDVTVDLAALEPERLDSYPHRIEPPRAPQIELLRSANLPQRLDRLEPERSWELEIRGPSRLRVESRAEFGDSRLRSSQTGTLILTRNGIERTFRFVSTVDPRAVTRGPSPRLGTTRTAYYDVPEGNHRYRLSTTAAVWVELRVVTPQDLAPAGLELGPTPQPIFLQRRPTITDVDFLTAESTSVFEHNAVSLMRDRSVRGARDAGLYSAQSLPGLGAEQRLRTLLGEYTGFRSLPARGPTGSLTWARFLPPATRHSSSLALRRDSLMHAAARTQRAAFHRLSATEEQSFALSGDFSRRRLRLAVRTGSAPTAATVTFRGAQRDVLESRQLLVFPEPLVDLGPTTAEAALLALHGGLQPSVTFQAPYGSGLRAAPLVDAAVGQWSAPRAATTVTLRSENSLEVALLEDFVQAFRLSETELRQLLDQGRRGARLAARLATLRGSAEGPRPSARRSELQNHYRPALRLLEARAGELGRDTEPLPPRAPSAPTVSLELADLAQARTSRELSAEQLGALVAELRERREIFLATRILQQTILYGSATARDAAQRQLDALYRETEDQTGLLRLRSWRFLEDPRPPTLLPLLEVLLASGQEVSALDLALLLPPEQRPPKLLAAAARNGWWLTHDELANRLGESERDEAMARAALYAGSASAVSSASVDADLERARQLRRALDRGEPEATSRWWRESPSTTETLRLVDGLVAEAAGSVQVEFENSTTDGRFWVANEEQPVRFDLVGSGSFELEVRPVHTSDGAAGPLDLTLHLDIGGERHAVPILGNGPSGGLQFTPGQGLAEGATPGSREILELSVEAGVWPAAIRPSSGQLLVRLRRREAALQPQALPTKASAWWPTITPAETALRESELCLWEPKGEQCSALPQRGFTPATPRSECSSCDRAASRVAPRGLSEEALAAYRLGARLLASSDPPSQEELGRALAALDRAPLRPQTSTLRRRLDALSRWRLVGSVEASAGVEQRRIEGTQPESPTLQTRFDLLGRLPPTMHVVQGSQALTIAPATNRSIELDLRMLRVPPLERQPVVVAWRFDEQPEQTIELTPADPTRQVTLRLPRAAQRLSVRMVEPVGNQYLGVTLWVTRGGRREALAPSALRSYQVASKQRSLKLRARGPGLLRIDSYDGRATRSRFAALEEGWQNLVLGPDAGSDRTLYRIFERAVDPLAERPKPRPTGPRTAPRTPRLTRFELPPTATAPPTLLDARASTLSVLAGGQRRRLLDEDNAEELGADEFFEAEVAWHRGSPTRQRQLRAVGRLREGGDPTIGGSARWRFAPRNSRYTMRLGASAFAQEIDDRAEWAATVRASAGRSFALSDRFRHRPQISLFARRLSLDESEDPATRVDQDVFTLYKAQHRAGLELSDVLTYDVGLTTQWFTTGSIRSNEELDPTDPDRAELQLGLRQYLRPFLFDLRVRQAFFFSDDDRRSSFDRTRLSLDLQWEGWNRQRDRWALESRIAYDFGTEELVGAILFGRYFSTGRGLRDLFPEPGEYRRLRLFAPDGP